MDNYTKAVLTVIAVALVGLNLKLWEPRPAHAAMATEGVTMESLMDSPNLSEADRQKLIARIPVVAVWKILQK